MEKPVKGDVVVIPFPFSDLTTAKKRPALVATNLTGEDLILCQITSTARTDDYSIGLDKEHFKSGCLDSTSIIRPNKLFTADKSIISYKIGSIKGNKIKEVEETIVKIFTE